MTMEKDQFKPFDKVLVRDCDTHPWRINFFSHYMPKYTDRGYVCASGTFNQCIPYNEETAHLVGTNNEYKPLQPKTYNVIFVAQNGDRHQVSYTDDEFKKFIETAVLNNKDVSNFDVRKICD